MDPLKSGSAPVPWCGELIKQSEALREFIVVLLCLFVTASQRETEKQEAAIADVWLESLNRHCFGYFTWVNQRFIA